MNYTKAVKIGWVPTEQLGALVALFAESYPDEHWTADDFQRFSGRSGRYDKRIGMARKNVIKTMSNSADGLIGAVLLTSYPKVIRVRRLAVRVPLRRQNIGRQIMTMVTHNALVGSKPMPVVTRVTERNLAGQLFLKALNFQFDPKLARERMENGDQFYEFTYGISPGAGTAAAATNSR